MHNAVIVLGRIYNYFGTLAAKHNLLSGGVAELTIYVYHFQAVVVGTGKWLVVVALVLEQGAALAGGAYAGYGLCECNPNKKSRPLEATVFN